MYVLHATYKSGTLTREGRCKFTFKRFCNALKRAELFKERKKKTHLPWCIGKEALMKSHFNIQLHDEPGSAVINEGAHHCLHVPQLLATLATY